MEEKIFERLDKIEKKIDKLNEVEVKNGGGRHITFMRAEFFQMLYDRGSFSKVSDKAYKYGLVILLVLQVFQIMKG